MKLRLQLRAGLLAPDAVVARARAQLGRLAKGASDADYWGVLAEAAARQGNGALRIEALERRLNRAAGSDARSQPAPAAVLWRVYLSEAQAIGNRDHLLAGDDAAWTDRAARRGGAAPQESRAMFAYLARNGSTAETRHGAQLQLVFSLFQSGLDYAALHLFSDGGVAADTLDVQSRYLLGDMAETRNFPALAVRFWQGLAAPPNTDRGEWLARFAIAQWRAGAADAALATMQALAQAGKPLAGSAAGRAVTLAAEMRGAGKPGLAEETLALLLPLVEGDAARDLLYALGECAESAAQFTRAADYYMRSALAGGARAPDAKALQARLAAASNLARAGLRVDARAQFQWVIDHSKDAGQVELARREQSRQ